MQHTFRLLPIAAFIPMWFILSVLIVPCLFGGDMPDNMAWQVPQEAINRTNPITSDSDSIGRGKILFKEYCTTCHGTEGRGDGPVAARLSTETPDLTETAGIKKDGELAWKISTGKSPMPKWGDKLTEKQIWDLVNFIQNL